MDVVDFEDFADTTHESDTFNYSDYENYDYSDDVRTDVIDFLKYVLPPTNMVLALVGNSLSAYVMYCMTSRVTWLCAYPMVLGLTDTAFFAMEMMSQGGWLTLVSGRNVYTDIVGHSNTTCKSYHFLRNFLSHFTSWVMVCLAIETYRTTKVPTRWKHFKKGRVVDTLVFLTATLTLLNAHFFWTWGRHAVEEISLRNLRYVTCTFGAKNLQGHYEGFEMKKLLLQMNWLFSDFLPMVFIGVVLVLLVHVRSGYKMIYPRVAEKYKLGDSFEHSTCTGRHMLFKDLRDRTFVILPLAFLTCHLPYIVCRELNDHMLSDRSVDAEVGWSLALVVLRIWRELNWSCKFFIYVSTCREFRTELRRIGSRVQTWGRSYICLVKRGQMTRVDRTLDA